MKSISQSSGKKRAVTGAAIGIILMVTQGLGFGTALAQNQAAVVSVHQFLYEYIYFKIDSTKVLPSSEDALQRKVLWLQQHPGMSVIIEGHCDSRGSEIDNLILGEARAGKIKSYLIQQGIAASRLLTISYGEADPVDTGENEEAYSKNRRARFVIQ